MKYQKANYLVVQYKDLRNMAKDLKYYTDCFDDLNRNMENGPAPHKPILLLSVIRMFEEGIFTNNQIYITPYLVASFKSYWKELVFSKHLPNFATPFFHLKSEPFWSLVPKEGQDRLLKSQRTICGLNGLTNSVSFAVIDKELMHLLLDVESREKLKSHLLNNCLPQEGIN